VVEMWRVALIVFAFIMCMALLIFYHEEVHVEACHLCGDYSARIGLNYDEMDNFYGLSVECKCSNELSEIVNKLNDIYLYHAIPVLVYFFLTSLIIVSKGE